MYSNEEMAEWPLAFFEEGIYPRLSPGLVEDLKLLAMDEVELVFVNPNELPEINLV
jgi:hypothetical protein